MSELNRQVPASWLSPSGVNYVNGETRYQFRWEHTSGHFFNEVTLATEKTTDSPSKSSNNPGKRYEGALGRTPALGFDTILQTDGVDPH